MTESHNTPAGPSQPQAPTHFVPEEDGENITLTEEFIFFLKENKKWWLIPLMLIVAGIGYIVVAGAGSALGPFIYSLF